MLFNQPRLIYRFSWLIATLSLVIILATSLIIVWVEKEIIRKHVRKDSITLAETMAGDLGKAMKSGDAAAVTDRCMLVLRTRDDLHYIVVVQQDGTRLIHTANTWRTEPATTRGEAPFATRRLSYKQHLSPITRTEILEVSAPVVVSDSQWGLVQLGFSMESTNRHFARLHRQAALLTLACFLLSILGSFLLARTIAKPIVRLTHAAQAVAAGDLNQSVAITSFEGIGALAEAFNKMTEELRKTTISRDYFDNLIESMIDTLIVVSLENRILNVNMAATALLGYSKRSLYGMSLTKIVARGDLPLGSSRSPSHEWHGVRDAEVRLRCRDGAKIPVLITTSVIRNGLHKPESVVIIAHDIAARKRSESERHQLERQLQQTQKMEAIGNLAGGVAHDMNNMLTVIMGLASTMRMDFEPGSIKREDIDAILSACKRGHDLTRNLLGYARKGKYRKEPISINHAIEEVFALLKRTISKKVKIEQQLAANLADIEGDPGQINQALVNLAINAVDAMGGKGTLSIATENITMSEKDMATHRGIAPGPFVRVRVSDTGSGMSEEVLRKACEPFFTTKPPGEGTGLGLAMVYGTIQNHGGFTGLDSTIGRGTTVTLYLPAILSTKTISKPQDTVSGPLKSGSGTILLVDDEELIRSSTRRLLEALGYQLFVADNGVAALAEYRENRVHIDLVLLDLIMPEMDGEETFHQLKKINPQVRILLSSGYSREKVADDLIFHGAVGFIQKPYTLQQISEMLSQILGPPTPG